ncbi:unnamed protein product [Meganyctiphanes norvegica]|uniref:Beta-hexosaminidase n=1 Tax=Meganyctiphanes norvegica TaxID=48144 RepID=A0AAV2Q1S8_MEGNR
MLAVVLLSVVCSLAAGSLPIIHGTVGAPWPKPHEMQHILPGYLTVDPDHFSFDVTNNNCDILTEAVKRYKDIMFNAPRAPKSKSRVSWHTASGFLGELTSMDVDLMEPCEELPHLDMYEGYNITVIDGSGTISSISIWGILRGLETFSQLLVPSGDAYLVNATTVRDWPRFSFRGLMLDTGRHYLPLSKIKDTLDLMAMNKLNVFHWHMVDDQSFPYKSDKFPKLSELGAWTQNQVYTADQIASVVEYARMRGIRVLPEFDTPGHTLSWGLGQSDFLTPCYLGNKPTGTYGPVDPTVEANYDFLRELLTEVTGRFKDHYIHLGGDEVPFTCWESNPNITTWMATHNITGDYAKLEEYYITRLLDIVDNLPKKNGYFVWQEVFDNGVKIANDTVVHVWKYRQDTRWKEETGNVTAAGYRTVVSTPWYLNDISYGVDWYKYYNADPQSFNGTLAQKDLVMGGEACMWGEYVDATNLTPRLWPRASVVAEKLWSSQDLTNGPMATAQATPRLEEHRCRLLLRGYDAEPLWPSYCDVNYD